MSARRIAVAAVAGLALTLGAAGCGEANSTEADGGVGIEVAEPEDGVKDCDDDDRPRRDKDCGVRVGGEWVEWSWVKAGRTTPPPGWDPARELRSITASTEPTRPSPKSTTVTKTKKRKS